MKKIIINGDYLTYENVAGVSRYATEILNEFDRIVDKWKVELLTPEYAITLPNYSNIKIVRLGHESLIWWKLITLPRYVRKQNGLLLDFTQAFPIGVKGITCVHDCIPELVYSAYAGIIGRLIKKPIKLLQRRIAINSSKAILTVSEYSKEDIIKIYHISPDKIFVVPNAWQHIKRVSYDNRILDQLGIDNKAYYFSLGSRVPHKNIEWIVAAAKDNVNSLFVVSGENRFCKTFDKKVFPDNIIFTGYVSDGEIRTLFANCKAFLFPSTYEGFGIPPLEALSEGAEIVVSYATSLPEIYEKSAHYINPMEYSDIDLVRILNTPVCDPDSILKKYSWEKSAQLLYEVVKAFVEGLE